MAYAAHNGRTGKRTILTIKNRMTNDNYYYLNMRDAGQRAKMLCSSLQRKAGHLVTLRADVCEN